MTHAIRYYVCHFFKCSFSHIYSGKRKKCVNCAWLLLYWLINTYSIIKAQVSSIYLLWRSKNCFQTESMNATWIPVGGAGPTRNCLMELYNTTREKYKKKVFLVVDKHRSEKK